MAAPEDDPRRGRVLTSAIVRGLLLAAILCLAVPTILSAAGRARHEEVAVAAVSGAFVGLGAIPFAFLGFYVARVRPSFERDSAAAFASFLGAFSIACVVLFQAVYLEGTLRGRFSIENGLANVGGWLAAWLQPRFDFIAGSSAIFVFPVVPVTVARLRGRWLLLQAALGAVASIPIGAKEPIVLAFWPVLVLAYELSGIGERRIRARFAQPAAETS